MAHFSRPGVSQSQICLRAREVLQNSCGAGQVVLEYAVRRVLRSIAVAIHLKMQRHSVFQDGFA
jgi:hypothetical protein